MVVFPTSFAASIFLIALSCWFSITVMTWSGVANVSKSYYEVARSLGADEWYLITRVALPAAMPSIFVGLFMGLGMAFVTLVVGEMLGVKAGLGWIIAWAQGWAEYSKVYAALVIMALLFSMHGVFPGGKKGKWTTTLNWWDYALPVKLMKNSVEFICRSVLCAIFSAVFVSGVLTNRSIAPV
ncbi:ABC transporter permease [Sporomusa carbonis]|uniref:ABC transporter permease n=1 Tax=Sporomusa carbonis TaxID=3076075 RepID=UPI003C7C02E9